MGQQYWIGGFYIDLSRNQITQNNQSQTIPPKALSVLTYLAKRQGEVVSQEELLDHVWEDSVVSPNTLQRSIAQLRKALGDDGKVQVYIKTHAKKGYSLECDVRWHDGVPTLEPKSTNDQGGSNANSDASTASIVASKPAVAAPISSGNTPASSSTNGWRHPALLVVIILLVIAGLIRSIISEPIESHRALEVASMRPLTATDHKELAGIYSPDGKYVIFHRYDDGFCSNNIWAKNIETQQEFQLTKQLNSYGSHSFSPDGKSLVFVQSVTCTAPVTQKKCYYLMELDFEQALVEPQEPTVRLECKNAEIAQPRWMQNNHIALLKRVSTQRQRIISYSLATRSAEVLFDEPGGNVIDYDYSVERDLLAVTSIKPDGGYYLTIVSSGGDVQSSYPINYPDEISPLRYVYPNFSVIDNSLVFSTGKQLFTLSYQGQVNNISLPVDEPMGTPVFHPNGKRMLVTKGHYDSDILRVALDNLRANDKPGNSEVLTNQWGDVLLRTNLEEAAGMMQPDGELLAFLSERSGQTQVWLYPTATPNAQPRQWSNFATDTFVGQYLWALDSQSVLVLADGVLHELFLDGSQRQISLDYGVANLFDWDSEHRTALVEVNVVGVPTFATIDLAKQHVELHSERRVEWAQYTSNNRFIYTDALQRFWLADEVDDRLLAALNDQGSDKHFIVRDNQVWGINDSLQLWSYSLTSHTLNPVVTVSNQVDYLTDIRHGVGIFTWRVAAKKEVVEVTLR